jgi:hypothetical protein
MAYAHRKREGGEMSGIVITAIEENDQGLDAIGLDEGCSTSTSCSSLDISDVDLE